jgi:hypothetical protein
MKNLQKMNLHLWFGCRNFWHNFTKLTSNVCPPKYTAHRSPQIASAFYLIFARERVKKHYIITRVSTVNITLWSRVQLRFELAWVSGDLTPCISVVI